jgi:hypothetical protein
MALPYKEKVLREILVALPEGTIPTTYNPKTDNLENIIFNSVSGIKIFSITEGQGFHHAEAYGQFFVRKGEMYATIDTTCVPSGSIATYIFSRSKKGLELKKTMTHAKS